MANERRQHICKQIHESEKKSNKLWATVNNIMYRKAMPSMPDSTDLPYLCASFSNFFVDTIGKIRLKFRTDSRKPKFIPPPEIKCHLTCFEPATSEEVRKLILTSPTRTCALDPIPTSLLKSCVDVLLTPITNIVNLSLKSGVFPDTLKLSHITPLLKKPSLSKDDMTNYRPVSNLNFTSKLLEKNIAKRIRSHLESNDLLNRYQSAYRPMHSTETALLEVQNDLLRNLDDGKTTVLVLLDLSAAFDTLDHSGVISLLENWYDISGNAPRWFASYLMDRQQVVKVKEFVGEPFQTKYGVSQGSVLGPLLFTLYTTPLSKIISRHNVCHHLYADLYHTIQLRTRDVIGTVAGLSVGRR